MIKSMSKTVFSGIIVLIILTGVFYMLNMYGFLPPLKYAVYSSKDVHINITTDYISGWICKENIGPHESYAQALFFLPRTKEVPYNALMAITIFDKAKSGFKNIDEFAEDILKKRNYFKNMKVIRRDKKELAGKETVNISLTYKKIDRLEGLDTKLIQVKESIVILENNRKFYEARYENKVSQFSKFNRAFSHMIESLKFK